MPAASARTTAATTARTIFTRACELIIKVTHMIYVLRFRRRSMKTPPASIRVTVVVAALVAVLPIVRAHAQAPAQDFSKVEIQTTQLAPNFYRLEAVGPVLVGNAGI